MNLYVCGWHVSSATAQRAWDALAGTAARIPQLKSHEQQCVESGPFTLGVIHPPEDVVAPRRPFADAGDSVVLVDGLPLAPSGGYCASDARVLGEHWGDVPRGLESQFAILRYSRTSRTLELCNDFLAGKPVYLLEVDEGWLISNRIGVLQQVSGSKALDPRGISTFVAFGWCSAEYTNLEAVRCLPPAQHWVWRDRPEPEKRSYYQFEQLEQIEPAPNLQAQAQDAIDSVGAICEYAAKASAAPVVCGLTGGQDSRVLAAIMKARGVDARYVTYGPVKSPETQVARQVAVALDIPHVARPLLGGGVESEWARIVPDFVRLTDGSLELWHVSVMLDRQPEVSQLGVSAGGQGGEITRGVFIPPGFLLGHPSPARTEQHIAHTLLAPRRPWMTPRSDQVVGEYIQEFVGDLDAARFAGDEVLEFLYLFERLGKWGGLVLRPSDPVTSYLRPFVSRAYLETGFRMPVRDRYGQRLHDEMLRLTYPELLRVPYSSRTKNTLVGRVLKDVLRARISKVYKSLLSKKRIKGSRISWINANRSEVESMFLDRPHSALWEFIDRPEVERHLRLPADSEELALAAEMLLRLLTLFYYEELCLS